jgi:signal transduction histidine kinase
MAESDSSPSAKEAYAQLLSLAVHEFRTPVSVVGGYLRMLQRDGDAPLSEQQKKMIAEAERACARIGVLIAELSEVSRLDAGLAAIQEADFDLFDVLTHVAADVHEAEDRGVLLKLQGPNVGALMRGDLARLSAAFSSCFRAVLREQPSSCSVIADRRLEVLARGTSAITIVAEESSLEAAYNASPARFDEKRGGLGLLLPIARRIIEHQGGRIWSPAPPGPTVAIIVSLPLGARTPVRSPEPNH